MSLPICGDCGKEIGLTHRCAHQPASVSVSSPEPESDLDEFLQTDSGEPIPIEAADIDGFFPANISV